MTANVATKDYFAKIENANWDSQRITSDGDITQRKPWLGRLCSCIHVRRGYDVVKAVDTVKSRISDYLGESAGPTDRVAREHTVHQAVNNLNTLIERVNQKRPKSKIELVNFAQLNAVKVSKKEESVASAGNSSDSVKKAPKRAAQDESHEITRKSRRDAATIREGQQFIKNFKKKEVSAE